MRVGCYSSTYVPLVVVQEVKQPGSDAGDATKQAACLVRLQVLAYLGISTVAGTLS